MLRSYRIISGDLQTPRARENIVHSFKKAVPRTDTGSLAEKAKTCKV